jgi:uncharacterized membrane protein HdeD (DUF308 family)
VAFGVVIAILGLVALFNAVDATMVTTIIVGWVLVIAGIASIVGAFTSESGLGWRILQGLLGVLYIVVGLEIVFDPLAGAIALTVVIALMLIIDGFMRLFGAFSERGPGWGWMVALAIVNILLGVWLWTGIPVSGVAIGIFVGIELLIAGIIWIMVGFSARSPEQPALA